LSVFWPSRSDGGSRPDRRDYAILLLLARLGLRRGEVAALELDDIDWRAAELTIVGKGKRVERLPLPAEPGEAIAAWLVDGRPECATRSVFTPSDQRGGRYRRERLAMSSAGHVRTPGLTGSVRTVCVIRWPRPCCRPRRRYRRWGTCCATAARCPPRSMPRSMRLLCDRWPGLGPAPHLLVQMMLSGVWLDRGRYLDHEHAA
jgi:hypothetical protein